MRTKLAIALALAAVFLLGAVPTAAAARAATGPVFTLNTTMPTASDVAAVWSKNTGVTVVVGSCDINVDENCITASYSYGVTDCLESEGTTIGCANWTGSRCYVLVASYAPQLGPNVEYNVLGHEVGHCLTRSAEHSTNRRDLLFSPLGQYDPRKVVTPETRARLRALYG